MTKTIPEILAPKPEARLRIYAYSIDDEAHKGLLKVGQTTRDVKQRVAEQLKTAAIKNYRIELDEPAEREDGSLFSDHEVRAALVKKRFENTELELIKFATRIPAFMYLTDFRENTLQDVITKLEPDLFLTVTGLTVKDFHLLVQLRVFNTEQMNQAVFAFRRYEDASLRYTGIESHPGLSHYGLYNTVVAKA
jgi:hypothetical protein